MEEEVQKTKTGMCMLSIMCIALIVTLYSVHKFYTKPVYGEIIRSCDDFLDEHSMKVVYNNDIKIKGWSKLDGDSDGIPCKNTKYPRKI